PSRGISRGGQTARGSNLRPPPSPTTVSAATLDDLEAVASCGGSSSPLTRGRPAKALARSDWRHTPVPGVHMAITAPVASLLKARLSMILLRGLSLRVPWTRNSSLFFIVLPVFHPSACHKARVRA